MSRIGKQPISVPPKVKVEIKAQKVFVEGPKGKLDFALPNRTSAKVDAGEISWWRATAMMPKRNASAWADPRYCQ